MVQNFIVENGLQPGDVVIARKRSYNIFDHFIVYLGCDNSGNWFMANSIERGVEKYNEDAVLTLVETFDPVKIRRFQGTEYERQIALSRALSQEGKEYSLFHCNCEHFANYVQKGIMESPQIGAWIGAGLLALFIGTLAFWRHKESNW